MLQDVFRQGHLDMSTEPLDALQVQLQWGDFLLNRSLCVVSIILWLILLSEYFQLLPELRYCVFRAKGNINLEHSLSLSRTRSILAAAMFLPFCLLSDRYQLFTPSWWDRIVEGGSILITCGICLTFVLIRLIASVLFAPRKLKGEERSAVHHVLANIFLVTIPVMMAAAGVERFAGLEDSTIRLTVIIGTGLSYLLVIFRELEILKMHCSGFSTFLYLCALDFVPVGILLFESLR